jgi:hypothetical protein
MPQSAVLFQSSIFASFSPPQTQQQQRRFVVGLET